MSLAILSCSALEGDFFGRCRDVVHIYNRTLPLESNNSRSSIMHLLACDLEILTSSWVLCSSMKHV